MLGLMQQWPLLCHKIMDHAGRQHADREIVSRSVEGPIVRTTYGRLRSRALQVAQRLERDGYGLGDRIATLAWNTARHVEVWYGVMGIGAVYHTLNPRLFPEQIAWIINHADDKAIFVDLTFLPLVEKLAPHAAEPEAGHRADRRGAHAGDRAAGRGGLRDVAGRGRRRFRLEATSTRARPPACATPPARRAIPRASSTATAPTCCTP